MAVSAIQWVVGSEAFGPLVTSVKGAIGTIDWSEIGTSFAGLGTAILGQLGKIGADMGRDIGAALPTIDIDWNQLAFNTAGLVSSLTDQINSTNWVDVGSGIGSALTNAVLAGISGANWLDQAIQNIQVQALALGVSIGAEIGKAFQSVNIGEKLWALDAAIRSALAEALLGAVSGIASTLTSSMGNFALNLPELNWSTFVGNFSWDTWIDELTWNTFIPTNLSWADFIPTQLSWSTFIPSTLSWSNFVENFAWGDWITPVDWGRWLGGLGGLFGGGGASANASGTSYFGGGMTWVGEQGPELVRLPQGSRIYNNGESRRMAAGSTINVAVHVGSINSEMDIHSTALKIARELRRNVR
jgi:hypothetical protein